MKKIVLLTAVVAFGAAVAQANVTLSMFNGYFYENDGTTPLSLDSTIVMLCDADGDGFGDLTQATTSWIADVDDVVVGRWNLNENAAGAGSSFDFFSFDLAGTVGTGDKLMLVWYDKTYGVGDAGPGEGVHFGTFRTDDAISFSDSGWFAPADGAAINLNFATVSAGGDSLDSTGIASYQTVPEPASAVLALLGGGMVYAARRRMRQYKD